MYAITIVGLGPGSLDLISLQTLDTLKNAPSVILRTERHPAAEALGAGGVRYLACDDLYEAHGSFEDVYRAIADRVIEAAQRDGSVVYAVPGDPMTAEQTVQLLLQAASAREDLAVSVLPAIGILPLIVHELRLDPGEGLLVADARGRLFRLRSEAPRADEHEAFHGSSALNTAIPTIWLQVDTPMVAGDLKLLLLEHYPAEHPITVLTALGVAGQQQVTTLPLAEIDRGTAITHLTSVYVPRLPWQLRKHTVDDLRAVLSLLRAEWGCPWDRQQDMRSLRHTLIEEAYETVDAIDRDDAQALAEELGDLLLNVIFLAQLGAEEGVFDFDDAVQALGDKLIRRHAHIFGTVEAETAQEVLRSWEHIKAGERAKKGETGLFADVALALPALARSQKLQKRAARVGFDWVDFRGPLLKLHEELEELSQELGIRETWSRPAILNDPLTPLPGVEQRVDAAAKSALVHEVGDILFAAVNLCRFLHLEAEDVMREANDRFVRRFHRLETEVQARGLKVDDLPLEELDKIWLEIKGND